MVLAPRIGIANSFLDAMGKLPKTVQKKVREFTAKFGTNPTSAAINYESLHNMRDPKVHTVRVDLAYRAVVVHPEAGDLYLLVWVDHHDEAMAWARDKVFDVHATTGAMQVIDMKFVDETNAQLAQQTVAQEHAGMHPTVAAVADPIGLFSPLSDEDLARAGVPRVLVPAVRAVYNEDDFDKLQPYLPPEAFEALYYATNGYDPCLIS